MTTEAKFAGATGDLGTPGIAPSPAPTINLLQQFLRAIAKPAAGIGAMMGTGSPDTQAQAGPKLLHPASPVDFNAAVGAAEQQAAKAPLAAPVEAAKGAVNSAVSGLTGGAAANLQEFVTQKGRVVGIYGLFVLVGLVGLIFLLSASGAPQAVARGAKKVLA